LGLFFQKNSSGHPAAPPIQTRNIHISSMHLHKYMTVNRKAIM
jgi:hypothetical protein